MAKIIESKDLFNRIRNQVDSDREAAQVDQFIDHLRSINLPSNPLPDLDRLYPPESHLLVFHGPSADCTRIDILDPYRTPLKEGFARFGLDFPCTIQDLFKGMALCHYLRIRLLMGSFKGEIGLEGFPPEYADAARNLFELEKAVLSNHTEVMASLYRFRAAQITAALDILRPAWRTGRFSY